MKIRVTKFQRKLNQKCLPLLIYYPISQEVPFEFCFNMKAISHWTCFFVCYLYQRVSCYSSYSVYTYSNFLKSCHTGPHKSCFESRIQNACHFCTYKSLVYVIFFFSCYCAHSRVEVNNHCYQETFMIQQNLPSWL